MKKIPPTDTQITAALIIAVFADILQIPATIAFLTGVLVIPAEAIIVAVDFMAMIAVCWLLGFHWFLLPSLVLELIPGLTVLPTWTACVLYVVNQRKDEGALPPPLPTIPTDYSSSEQTQKTENNKL